MAALTQAVRLPGVYFEVEPRPPAQALPRMDIAAFVGLAAAGPLHVPVAVEDAGHLRDIFGDDLALAWDAETAQAGYAHLVPAVEAFFRNGGRRCWVVRVADAAAATANRFALPGLIRAGDWRPAAARARCAGSWSDAQRTSCLLAQEALGLATFGAGPAYSVTLPPESGLAAGDVLKLTFEAAAGQLLLFLAVASARRGAAGQQATATEGHWFRRLFPGGASPWTAELDGTAAVHRPGDDPGAAPAQAACTVRLPAEIGDGYEVQFLAPPDPSPARGDVLHVTLDGGGLLLLAVGTAVETTAPGSPPAGVTVVRGTEGLWPEPDAAAAQAEVAGLRPLVERLTFSILAWQGREIAARLDGLGLAAAHGRFWGRLPVDEVLFGLVQDRFVPPEPGSLEAAALSPRFPLAAPEGPAGLYLPLGMDTAPDWETAVEAIALQPGDISPDTALARDGLAAFDSSLFLDPTLKSVGSGALLAEAFHKHYIRGEPLTGLHSLLPLDEVTIAGVPDAAQRGWQLAESRPLDLLLAPELAAVSYPEGARFYGLSWTAVDGAGEYLVQEAREPSFELPVTAYQGPLTGHFVPVPDDCPARYCYRVRALSGTRIGPWSNTVSVVAPRSDFAACAVRVLAAPQLSRIAHASPPGADDELVWTTVEGATGYRLEEATDPAFVTAVVLFGAPEAAPCAEVGGLCAAELPARQGEGVYYYRVRAERDGEPGPWSATVIVVSIAPAQHWEMIAPEAYDPTDLLAVQRGLLHFCAARADLLAVLSMPGHYRPVQVLAHVAALSPTTEDDEALGLGVSLAAGDPPALADDRALSYGVLYHPWLLTHVRAQDGSETTRPLPPCGAAGGLIAAIAVERGAWIAPANRPLVDVVSLDPAIDRAGWARLYDRQVNLVRQDPRGFVLLSANTLYPGGELRPINVRRLLILLRRLALREGDAFVFAPNGEAFRRRIYHRFDALLAGMYGRGAFAGSTAAAAYRVVTDSSVNTPISIDQGRLIVELQVAPSRPMAFITVRLVQRDLSGLSVEEV